MKFLFAALAAIAFFMLPAQAQSPASPPSAADLAKLAATTSIGVAPGFVHAGDQAVLLIVSPYQKGVTHPVRLNTAHPPAGIETVALFNKEIRYIGQTPDSVAIAVYHIVLKTNGYTFTPGDFVNLPAGFKFPKITLKLVQP